MICFSFFYFKDILWGIIAPNLPSGYATDYGNTLMVASHGTHRTKKPLEKLGKSGFMGRLHTKVAALTDMSTTDLAYSRVGFVGARQKIQLA